MSITRTPAIGPLAEVEFVILSPSICPWRACIAAVRGHVDDDAVMELHALREQVAHQQMRWPSNRPG
ncbi:MAG: hypothetical protein KIS83_14120 [Rubrivivax sp.]|nr:hypothetical protein [Rubrivivax sp.]